MDKIKPLIYDLSLPELEDQMTALGQPRFRAKQIWVAIYQNLMTAPQEITTLPKSLRDTLAENYSFRALESVRRIKSADGLTVKDLFMLRDGYPIEAVLMYYDERRTLCISSQSGCAIGCSFCATGQMGFKRHLTSGEIIAQVLFYASLLAEAEQHVTNIVVMGMGEPFLNFDNLMSALDRLNDPKAFGLGARRLTVSTVGIVPGIKKFADAETQYNLAISLHTVDNELRSSLIPVNKKYPVEDVLDACRYYIGKTNRRITFEYALIDNLNDSASDADALVRKIRGMICHVNLIPLNPTSGYSGQPTQTDKVQKFAEVLESNGIPCTVRLRRGVEIGAGCGQLAAEVHTNGE
jgi:23S rRNA (adenine2503-C2)-methyltransferase